MSDYFPFKDCLPFLEHFLSGILSDGLLVPLQEFGDQGDAPINSAAKDIYKELLADKDLGAGFYAPKKQQFHPTITGLIKLSEATGALDFILGDMITAIKTGEGENDDDIINNLNLTLEKWKKKSSESPES